MPKIWGKRFYPQVEYLFFRYPGNFTFGVGYGAKKIIKRKVKFYGEKKILVVDDEKDLVEMISLRLEASDFMVIKAYDGQAGLELARTKKPDLLF